MATLICQEDSEKYFLTKGKKYNVDVDEEDIAEERYCYVVNDAKRRVHVRLNRFLAPGQSVSY